MTKNTYIFLAFTLCLLTFTFTFGCGKYTVQYSAPVILERSPTSGAGSIESTETLWIKFSKSMDTTGVSSISALATKIKYATDMTATVTFDAGLTPEVVWSDDDTKLTLRNVFFIASPGNKVHFQASREAFQDVSGLYITENAILWSFTLSN
ncbi:MAG: hypothetical protein ABH860_06045 [bacterium]